jgi:hypothetical protein
MSRNLQQVLSIDLNIIGTENQFTNKNKNVKKMKTQLHKGHCDILKDKLESLDYNFCRENPEYRWILETVVTKLHKHQKNHYDDGFLNFTKEETEVIKQVLESDFITIEQENLILKKRLKMNEVMLQNIAKLSYYSSCFDIKDLLTLKNKLENGGTLTTDNEDYLKKVILIVEKINPDWYCS